MAPSVGADKGCPGGQTRFESDGQTIFVFTVDHGPSHSMKQFLDRLERMFHICSHAAALKEKAECPAPSKPFRLPPPAIDRSGRSAQREGAWRGGVPPPNKCARRAPSGKGDRRSLEPLRSGRRRCGVGGLGGTAARREMVPQRLEKVQFAPGNGMAPADLDPNIWRRRPPRAPPEESPPPLAEWPNSRFARNDDVLQGAGSIRLGEGAGQDQDLQCAYRAAPYGKAMISATITVVFPI
jgi:hypothetical protein